jgi:hypothetical protein
VNKSFSQNVAAAAPGLCSKKQLKPQATLFRSNALFHHCKIPDALATAPGHHFYRLSPEAVRLTIMGQNQHISKEAQ